MEPISFLAQLEYFYFLHEAKLLLLPGNNFLGIHKRATENFECNNDIR